MMDCVRTIVDIPNDQLQRLAQLCEQENCSRAEAIRRAIARFIEERSRPNSDAFGLWRSRDQDGLSYQQSIRAEWEP